MSSKPSKNSCPNTKPNNMLRTLKRVLWGNWRNNVGSLSNKASMSKIYLKRYTERKIAVYWILMNDPREISIN
jgi:hypothetical protein